MLTLVALLLASTLTSTVRIAPPTEPGERLVLTGTMYRADGRTPAANVVLLAYHTNVKGIYPRGLTGGQRGTLQGRLRTDAQGRYRIVSRHDFTLLATPHDERGRVQGAESLRIANSAEFWRPSKFLIILQEEPGATVQGTD